MEANNQDAILIKRFRENIILPKRSTEGAACYDLYMPSDGEVLPHRTVRIPLGFGIAFSKDLALLIQQRSSLLLLGLHTGPGIVDSDFRGEVSLILTNASDKVYRWKKHDRIGQMLFVRIATPELQLADDLGSTKRVSRW
ncbi:MAG: hypothetical protein DRP00_03550 [Candidatus Aenigmatarchaeota archaeon]|nr:MAG: hypothetical protein DRP00_03550 [Candidatus Aenigmarchaeota archaeon]